MSTASDGHSLLNRALAVLETELLEQAPYPFPFGRVRQTQSGGDVVDLILDALEQLPDQAAVQSLLRSLCGSRDYLVRLRAAFRLARRGDREAQDVLRRAVEGGRGACERLQAAYLLSVTGHDAAPGHLRRFLSYSHHASVLPYYVEYVVGLARGEVLPLDPTQRPSAQRAGDIRAETWRIRNEAAGSLLSIGDDEALRFLRRELADRDGDPEAAAVALARAGCDDGVQALMGRLRESHRDARVRAAAFLGQVKAEAAIGALTDALADTEWVVRRAAARALGNLPEERRAAQALDALLSSPDEEEVRVAAAGTLGAWGHGAALDFLWDLAASSSDAALAAEALHSIGRAGTPEGLKLLRAWLERGRRELRHCALEWLLEAGDKEALVVACDVLTGARSDVRMKRAADLTPGLSPQTLLMAVAALADPGALRHVAAFLEDASPSVRLYAAYAIIGIEARRPDAACAAPN